MRPLIRWAASRVVYPCRTVCTCCQRKSTASFLYDRLSPCWHFDTGVLRVFCAFLILVPCRYLYPYLFMEVCKYKSTQVCVCIHNMAHFRVNGVFCAGWAPFPPARYGPATPTSSSTNWPPPHTANTRRVDYETADEQETGLYWASQRRRPVEKELHLVERFLPNERCGSRGWSWVLWLENLPRMWSGVELLKRQKKSSIYGKARMLVAYWT